MIALPVQYYGLCEHARCSLVLNHKYEKHVLHDQLLEQCDRI